MNTHTIHGRLVRDPELTKGDTDRCKFTVACDRRYGDETDFFDCVIFGKRAGVIDKYFGKGSEILLSGEGQLHSYEDRNGVKRKSYSIVVADFDFCGSKSDSKGNTPMTDAQAREVEKQAKTLLGVDNFEEQEEDIPF